MATIKEISSGRYLVTKRILFLILLFMFLPVSAFTQQEPDTSRESVPEEFQVPIFLKILTYDRSLETRVRDTIHIGILCFPKDIRSTKNRDAIIENLKLNKDKTINGFPFDFVEIGFSTEAELQKIIENKHISFLYITSNSVYIPEAIPKIARAKKILTITGRADYVNRGISVGLNAQNGAPQILVNLDSARAEGTDFSASLLKLCKIVGSEK